MTRQQNARLLLVEDSRSLARVYLEYLKALPVDVTHVTEGLAGMEVISKEKPDVLLLDLNLPDINGLELMSQLEQLPQKPTVIVITAHGSVDRAVEAMRAGAFDFLQKPFDAERLRVTVRNALEGQNLKALVKTYQDSFERASFHGFIGCSIPIQAIYRIIESAASSRASVFITGESGSGKEVCADAIHNEGNRRDQPFIALNCAAIPRELMESEIFGHVKGAFTGASGDRMGAATMANGGTLFLDEIGEMDLAMQSKLLRFIQTGTFQKVGGSKMEKVDVRFVCATNRDPLEMVEKRALREDLYYRLYVIPIHLPPLRSCGGDIMLIARKYLKDYAQEEGKKFKDFSADAAQLISRYQWPGNVRQLQNVIRNIVVLQDGETITLQMLPALMNDGSGESSAHPPRSQTELIQASIEKQPVKPLWLREKEVIESAINDCGGNVPRAAALLEVSPSTIYRKRQLWEEK
ncbi:MAG: sigma-54 dependent transcriptional regulator [Xanthomonadales bacterium]